MDVERWRKIDQLYHSALELKRSRWAAFLTQACDGDESLEREVASLLDQSEETEGFLEASALEVEAKAMAMSAGERGTTPVRSFPAAVGRYRIIRLLGEGGMGAVYEAEQEEPRRVVALKVIRPTLATPERIWRFKHESQALGRLQHPGIAQIYEASTAETGFGPQPYFAMELIRGHPLGRYAQASGLDTRQRLALMVKICEAVHHAHQRGLIHRDLKPGNIMVDETGQPKILDFGVARVTGSDAQATLQTDWGQLVGTLAYMSPEQVLADPLEVDIRSDVYSLGVIFYQLLSGRLPYEVNRRQLHEAVQTIREGDPRPLGSISHDCRGDIEIIVGRALEKDKTRRYASAADLAADIQRYLNDEPIAARPPSAGYQLRKFARRRRALVAAVAAVFVALLAGVTASTFQAIRANRAGRAALAERDRAAIAEQAAMRDRDRAWHAERAATSERNRAVAAEAKAIEERNRALAEKRRADDESATATAVNDFLRNDLLAQAGPYVQARPNTNPDPDLKVRTALDRAAARIPGKFDKQPVVEAAIRQTIGSTYSQLGIYAQAQKQFERALDLRHRVLGEDHPDTLRVMSCLGSVYRMQAKFKQAESLSATVLEVRRRVLGESHPDTLASMDDLAVLYMSTGRYALAEPLWSRSLEIERRLLGEDHRTTANTMNSLAWLYRSAGKYKEAEPLQSKSLDIWRRTLGEEHPSTLAGMSGLAALYFAEAKYPRAEALLNKTLEVQRRVLGEEHPGTLANMHMLAATYRAEGKYQQAESLYIRAMEIKRRVQGEDHPAISVTMNGLAALYRIEGRYAEAEPLQIRALEIQRRAWGEEHRTTLVTMHNLAALYRAEEKYADAEALLRKTLELERRVLGEENPETLRSMNALASLYRSQGRYAEAEPVLTSVLEIDRRMLGPQHPRTADAMASLGDVELRQQKYVVAEPLIREVLGVREKANPDTWDRYYGQALLGVSLAGQKRYAEAEPLLVLGHQGMLQRESKIPAESRGALTQAAEQIVQLYESWGKPERAAEWRERLRIK